MINWGRLSILKSNATPDIHPMFRPYYMRSPKTVLRDEPIRVITDHRKGNKRDDFNH